MIKHSLEVFDLDLRRTAYFDTASDVVETVKINQVSSLTFRLPATDKKIELCRFRHYVRANGGELYRIVDKQTDIKDNATVLFQCEHVIATLIDDILWKDHVIGNIGTFTDEVIRYVLSHQTSQRWVLDVCDFQRQFEYGWTNENLLNALFSITDPFTSPFIWRFDTSVYPWRLSLMEIDVTANPQFYVFRGLNWRESQNQEMSSQVFTRIYPLGYGEGVNQLGIESVNGGVPYVDASPQAIEKYGLINGVWVDRRYESAANLLAAAQAMVKNLSVPYLQYKIGVADVYQTTQNELYRAEIGKIVQFEDGFKTFITEVKRNYDKDGDITIAVSNKVQTVASTLADMAERQRIEATYSQGATQLWGSPLQDNATPSEQFVYNLWIPAETKIMNKVMMKVRLSAFRAYSGVTQSGGGSSQTSSDGGGSSQTSSADGESARTSGPSNRSTSDSAYGESIRSGTPSTNTTTYADGSEGQHRHQMQEHTHNTYMPQHSHGMSHTHTFETPAHTHTVNIPGHSHGVTIPPHSHEIKPGIYYASERPAGAQVTINGTAAFSIGTEYEGNITQYLVDPDDGTIPRGRWIEIGIKPDTNAYVVVSVAAQGFIQSKGGGTY